MNLFDFLDPSERADVTRRALSIDVAPSIQRALDAGNDFPDGVLTLPIGSYLLGSPLHNRYDIRLEGAGQRQALGGVHAPTELICGAAMRSALIFGGAEQNIGSGGISGIKVDGRGLADYALEIVDVEHCSFERLLVMYGKKAGIYLHNSPTQAYPSAFLHFSQINIIERAGPTPDGHCLMIDGTCAQASSSQGVASCTFTQFLCEHERGAGVWIGNVGDSCNWNYLQTFSTEPTSYGVAFVRTDPRAINGGHLFLAPVVGRMYVADPGNQADTTVVAFDDTNTGLTPLVCGPGGSNINFMSRYGSVGGHLKTLGTKSTVRHDAMKFVHYDPANRLLFTEHGTWRATGQVFDTGTPGGGVRFIGIGTAPAAIFNASTIGVGGLTANLNPRFIATVSLADMAGTYRIGFADSLDSPPRNGIYWQYDPASDPERLRCVCRRDGKDEISIASAVTPSSDVSTFGINVESGRVNFWSNGAPYIVPFFAGSIAERIPQVPLNTVFQALRGSIDVLDYKCGYDTERS